MTDDTKDLVTALQDARSALLMVLSPRIDALLEPHVSKLAHTAIDGARVALNAHLGFTPEGDPPSR
jgi:hypothetical protein